MNTNINAINFNVKDIDPIMYVFNNGSNYDTLCICFDIMIIVRSLKNMDEIKKRCYRI